MKLIIDISEGVYKNIDSIQNGSIGSKQIINKVKNGIPLEDYLHALKDRGFLLHSVDVLDKMRAEIQMMADDEWNKQVGASKGLEEALEIIDKYREGVSD